MKSPIETLLDDIVFQELPAPEIVTDGIPYATHRGVFTIAGVELECFVLNTGQRVFSEESMAQFVRGFTCQK